MPVSRLTARNIRTQASCASCSIAVACSAYSAVVIKSFFASENIATRRSMIRTLCASTSSSLVPTTVAYSGGLCVGVASFYSSLIFTCQVAASYCFKSVCVSISGHTIGYGAQEPRTANRINSTSGTASALWIKKLACRTSGDKI